MRAWQVHELGEPLEVMSLDDVDDPRPGPGEVVLRIEASGAAFPDLLQVRGGYQVKPRLPFTPGTEIVGRIEAVGEGVEDTEVGRRVAWLGHSGFAEAVAAPLDALLAVPDDLDAATAACLPINYCTTWFALHDRAGLVAGETLLVHAAAGGVGSAAVQLGRHAGARVIATAGGPDKVEVCRQLGADVALDSRADDLVDQIKAATGGRGVDVAYDPVGGDLFEVTRRAMAWDGRLLVIGFTAGIPQAPANHVLLKNYSIVGVHWGASIARDGGSLRRQWDHVLAAVHQGPADPLIHSRRPLAEVPQALDDIGARRTTGKVVILPGA